MSVSGCVVSHVCVFDQLPFAVTHQCLETGSFDFYPPSMKLL